MASDEPKANASLYYSHNTRLLAVLMDDAPKVAPEAYYGPREGKFYATSFKDAFDGKDLNFALRKDLPPKMTAGDPMFSDEAAIHMQHERMIRVHVDPANPAKARATAAMNDNSDREDDFSNYLESFSAKGAAIAEAAEAARQAALPRAPLVPLGAPPQNYDPRATLFISQRIDKDDKVVNGSHSLEIATDHAKTARSSDPVKAMGDLIASGKAKPAEFWPEQVGSNWRVTGYVQFVTAAQAAKELTHLRSGVPDNCQSRDGGSVSFPDYIGVDPTANLAGILARNPGAVLHDRGLHGIGEAARSLSAPGAGIPADRDPGTPLVMPAANGRTPLNDGKVTTLVVSKAEVEEAIAAIAKRTEPASPTANAIRHLSSAIQQPQWARGSDGKLRTTGEVKSGLDALEALRDGFGKGEHRKLSFSAARIGHLVAPGKGLVPPGFAETLGKAAALSQSRDDAFHAGRTASPRARQGGASR